MSKESTKYDIKKISKRVRVPLVMSEVFVIFFFSKNHLFHFH